MCQCTSKEKSEREKNQFYEHLKRMNKQYHLHNIKIMLGDTNAKVRKEMWTGIAVSTCDLHDESNDNVNVNTGHV